ncbi:MAG TPA: alpha/beta fold hydrolase [Candidatus Binataceae bacterium]|nr:alpha/beta fold hydrolase [Candidatus Binataceae bacterium]
MKEERVTFKSGELTLEGMIALPDGAGQHRAAVVCHPHPLYGGSMYNNVVDAVLEALHAHGFATLRFNFRGVGQSEGEFDNGNGEADDAVAALRFLTTQKGVRATDAVLAGYSFGATAAVRAAASAAEVAAIVAVALPLGMIDPSALGTITKPIVLLAGDRDSYCPANHLAALAERLGPSARLRIIPGADHFFGGRESEIVAALVEELATL